LISFLAFALPLTFYLGFPSTFWNFDGVACAAALELGQPAYFFHANHLLYGFLGFLFWKYIGAPLGILRALPALQLFTSILSALGLVGLYRLLLPLLKNRWGALLMTTTMGLTAAFWVWSIEAQVYPLGFLALAWATFVLIHQQGPMKYKLTGLLHGAAVLGHLMHVLWIVPALYWIYAETKILHIVTVKAIRHYLTSLAIVTIIPYLLVVTFVIAPGRSLARVLIWLKGSAGLTPDRSWSWHSSGLKGPWLWLTSTGPAFLGSFWPYGKTVVTPWLWILTGISACLILALLIKGWDLKSERLARFSWIWLGTYGLFLSTWEPITYCYRMTDILPWAILLALGLKSWKASSQLLIAGVLLLTTATINVSTRAAPMRDIEQNVVYEDVLTLSRMTPPNSLYITTGGLPWIYLLYFTGRTAWNAKHFEATRLAEEIARQKKMRPIYVQRDGSWEQVL